jgi:acetylornithine/LysW-gamma-L-lysine aminotransferase
MPAHETATITATPAAVFPQPNISNGHWQSVESAHTCGIYSKRPLTIVRGAGAHVWDDAGNMYIDCVGGQGAANLGHCHPAVVAAVQQQAPQLLSCPEIFYNDQRAALLQRLVELAQPGIERAFLCNSGTEAVEAAYKFARASTGRPAVISAKRSFHGRTMGALSLTGQDKYREPFEPLLAGVTHVTYNCVDGLATALSNQTAAVILEVVQGEGGVRPADSQYLLAAQRLCHEHGALLIIDEVQTGIGRTGRIFASEHSGVQPDLLCIAKSLAGGMPIGAVLIGRRVGALPSGLHGSTFGGNPLACAAALAALQALQSEQLPQRAERMGTALMQNLRAANLSSVREVRGLGLLIGLELKSKVTPVLQALQTRGVLALPAGNTVLRLLPPLVISEEDLACVQHAVIEVLRSIG